MEIVDRQYPIDTVDITPTEQGFQNIKLALTQSVEQTQRAVIRIEEWLVAETDNDDQWYEVGSRIGAMFGRNCFEDMVSVYIQELQRRKNDMQEGIDEIDKHT